MEDDLMNTKFWDYRLVSPDTATMMFIYAYGKRFPSYNERLGKSPYINILKTLDFESPSHWKNWATSQRLRRYCDSLCMRYEEFWNWSCEEHEAAGNPAFFMTAFGTKFIMEKVKGRLEANRKCHLAVSKHPHFLAPAYRDCGLQNEYYGSLLSNIKKNYGASSIKVVIEMMDEGIVPQRYFNRKGNI